MLNEDDTEKAAAIASMSAHHGSYTELCECDGQPFLSHSIVGHQLYHYSEPPPDDAA